MQVCCYEQLQVCSKFKAVLYKDKIHLSQKSYLKEATNNIKLDTSAMFFACSINDLV